MHRDAPGSVPGSTPAPAPAHEPLALTVHAVDAPDLSDSAAADERRTARGRAKMLLLLALCAAPVALSYLMYFFVRPSATNNYGTLIQPTRSLPALDLVTLDGRRVAASSLRGQWLLVALVGDACDSTCERRLLVQRQLREMLGRDRERVDKVVLHIGSVPMPGRLRTALLTAPGATVLDADRQAIARWLEPGTRPGPRGSPLPRGPDGASGMLRVPPQPDPAKLKRDLERLLRASAGWDLPGR